MGGDLLFGQVSVDGVEALFFLVEFEEGSCFFVVDSEAVFDDVDRIIIPFDDRAAADVADTLLFGGIENEVVGGPTFFAGDAVCDPVNHLFV